MRNVALGVVAALAAALLPEVVAACIHYDVELLELELVSVEADGVEVEDRSAWEAFDVSIESGPGSIDFHAVPKGGGSAYHASYALAQ